MLRLIGHLHPVLVHLPIGILTLGLILFWKNRLSGKQANSQLAFIFLVSGITALLSCITGYVLAVNGDDYASLVWSHRNAAFLLTILTFTCWWLLVKNQLPELQKVLTLILAVMLLVTGHQGGTLTHGEGFLWGKGSETADQLPPIQHINEALVYQDIIAPVLQQKCVSCHGPNKQKGKLRLDGQEWIKKGGKSGRSLVGGHTDSSEIMTRILLPPDDEDHMPPKEKGQLSMQQKALIQWWIKSGASYIAKVKDLSPDAAIQPALASLTSRETHTVHEPSLSLPVVAPAPKEVISRLQEKGVVVVPIAQGSNLLNVNLINLGTLPDSLVNDLGAIAPQLYWLKAEGPMVTDEVVEKLARATNLHRLSLAHAAVTEKSRPLLKSLTSLEWINLYGTELEEKKKTDTVSVTQ